MGTSRVLAKPRERPRRFAGEKGAGSRTCGFGNTGPATATELCADERGRHGVGVDVDNLRKRDRDLAIPVDQRLGADDRHADQASIGVEAQRVALGRLVEVNGRRRVAHVQVEHVAVGVVEDVVEKWMSRS